MGINVENGEANVRTRECCACSVKEQESAVRVVLKNKRVLCV